MPIKWSPRAVSDALDKIEAEIDLAKEPLRRARALIKETNKIPDLPEYVTGYLRSLDGEIQRAAFGETWHNSNPEGKWFTLIRLVREHIPAGAAEAERNRPVTRSLL